MRQYQPIWTQLKKKGTASLIAPLILHPRIIQAVRKEKCSDEGWKLLTSEAGIKYRLIKEVRIHKGASSGIIIFTLRDVTGITLKDL